MVFGIITSIINYLDIQAILGDDQLLIRLHETVRTRNLKGGAYVTIKVLDNVKGNCEQEGESHVLIPLTEFNELPDGRFLEPDFGHVASINHYNLVLI